MTMKKILAILFLLVFAAGCEKEDILLSERDLIEKYLAGRKIYSESEVGSVIQDNPPFYQVFGRYAYRHIVNYYDEGREDRAIIGMGDKIEITFFNACTFTGSEPAQSAIYWSNIPEIIDNLGSKSSNTLDWPSEPLAITLGETEILEGLEISLPGCRDADSVQVYMTSNLAYGKQLTGVVPKNSMVAWYMKIEKVTK